MRTRRPRLSQVPLEELDQIEVVHPDLRPRQRLACRAPVGRARVAVLRAVAPLGAAPGVLALIGLHLSAPRSTGQRGLAAMLIVLIGVVGVVGVEFVVN